MLKLSDIKEDLRFPSFVRDHKVFNSQLEIKKIFPEIGLENFTEQACIENSEEILKASEALIIAIRAQVDARLYSLTRYAEIKNGGIDKAFGDNRKVKFRKCQTLLKKFRTLLMKPFKNFVIVNEKTGKITLNIHASILDETKKVLFSRGEGLFRVYQKLNEMLREGHFIALEALDNLPEFKTYNSVNIPTNESKIVFSSSGMEGAWDLATMSERGVQSCQSWHQSNASHLVGSIIDPCTAIMYLTTGSNHDGKGLKMMRRSIIRFIINGLTNKPTLIVERMFPAANQDVANKFIEILREKTQNKFEILNHTDNRKTGLNGFFIPLTSLLSTVDPKSLPYRDSAIPFKEVASNYSSYAESIIQHIKAHRYASKIMEAPKLIRLKDLSSKNDKKAWKRMREPSFPIYGLYTESNFRMRPMLDEIIKNSFKNTPTSSNISASLQVLNSLFSSSNIKSLVGNIITRFFISEKLSISNEYKALIRNKMESAIQSQLEKDRINLTAKIAKTKISSVLLDNEVLDLLDKVS